MKKTLSLLLTLCMLFAVCVPMAVHAKGIAATAQNMFWVTHYNDNSVEGAGTIFTRPYQGGAWWLHVAFAPAEDGLYEVVAISDGLVNGDGVPLDIPEGGFVWAANYGNDYISLGMGDTDYTNANCASALEDAKTWRIGEKFVIEGIDFVTVPTTTPDVLWYDDSYVCTATIKRYLEGTPDLPNAKGNLAAGKRYTTVGLYPDSFSPYYPDENGVTLTDGVSVPEVMDFSDPVWVGFNAQSYEYSMFEGAVIEVDLGETQTFHKGVVHTYKQTDVGITVPYGVRFSVSDDGFDYTEVGSVSIDPAKIAEGAYDIVCDFHTVANARYVKINLFLNGWGFVSEIGLYCEAGEAADEATNLALGKKVAYAEVNGQDGKYNADLTDGIASDTISYDGDWFAFYYNLNYCNDFNHTIGANSVGGVATPVIDLGETCNLDCVRVNMFLGNDAGVTAPQGVYAEVSDDGLTYSLMGMMRFDALPEMGDTMVGWLEFDVPEGVTARYVRLYMPHRLNWIFLNEIEIYGAPSDEPAVPDEYVEEIESMIGSIENPSFDLVMNAVTDADGKVTVTLTLENIAEGIDLTGFVAHMCFDEERLELITPVLDGITLDCITQAPGESWHQDNLTHYDKNNQVISIGVSSFSGEIIPISAENPLVLTFTFQLKEEYTYGAIYVPTEGILACDYYFNYYYSNGVYVIAERPVPAITYGDVNGDGEINGLDATRLLQYLANYDYANGVGTIDVSDGADCNGDGVIDGRDSVRLLRYLADFDPATGSSSVILGK